MYEQKVGGPGIRYPQTPGINVLQGWDCAAEKGLSPGLILKFIKKERI
jgi:hypothetical protein